MSILWKPERARTPLYFNDLHKTRKGESLTIHFLGGRIQLSKVQFATKTAGLGHPGTCGKRALASNDRPGLYRLDLVIKDVQSGNVGVVNTRLAVPRYADDKLDASTLILADELQHVPANQIGAGQFVLGSTKVRPRLESDFNSDSRLGIYLQVYNLKPDEKTHKSNATFLYTVKKGSEQVMQFKETSAEMKQTGDQVTIERWLPLSTLSPGKYTLEINATDGISNQSISKSADFTVKGTPEPTKAAANTVPGR